MDLQVIRDVFGGPKTLPSLTLDPPGGEGEVSLHIESMPLEQALASGTRLLSPHPPCDAARIMIAHTHAP